MELPGVNDDLASSIILKGVSVARRTVENPLSFVSERFDITIPRCHAEPSGEVSRISSSMHQCVSDVERVPDLSQH